MLDSHPFKGGSKTAAMQYLCSLHNIVNERLKKPIFDCSVVGKYWSSKDCGCNPLDLLKNYQAEQAAHKAELARASEQVIKLDNQHQTTQPLKLQV